MLDATQARIRTDSAGAPTAHRRRFATAALLMTVVFLAAPTTGRTACGDFNSDGSITPSDALGVLQVVLGFRTCSPVDCDVDNSGSIVMTDVAIVLRKGVGVDIQLTCPPGDDGWHPSLGVTPRFRLANEDSFHVHQARPRLFFRPADIPWLVARGQGALSGQWNELSWMASSMAGEDPTGPTATGSVKGWTGEKGQAVALMALLTGNEAYATWAIRWAKALGAPPTPTDDTTLRARAERIAVVYDWLHDDMSPADRAAIRDALVRYVEALAALDYMADPTYVGGHARWGYAALAMTLIALEGDYADPQGLLAQCRNHIVYGFLPVQAWIGESGGYHMGWAYSSAYTTLDRPYLAWTIATNDVLLDDWMTRLADWYIYGLRGDDRFPEAGDAYSLKPELGSASAIYAAGIGKSGTARWYMNEKLAANQDAFLQLLLLDPTVTPTPPTSLGAAKHFENAGVVIARDGWGADATQLVFKSSSFYSDNHHHQDQNSFTLHYKTALAMDSGYYDRHGSSHFKNYFTRTIAHNAIVVRDPTQVMKRFGETVSNDGGQVFRAEPRTLADIAAGGSASLDGVIRFEEREDLTYMVGDATKAYDGERVELAQREIVFLRDTTRPRPVVVVYDRVRSTNPGLEKRFILHMPDMPEVNGRRAQASHAGGRLTSIAVHPTDAQLTVVGGPGKEFSVGGQNYPLISGAASTAASNDIQPGSWRLEVGPAEATADTRLLNVLFVDDDTAPEVTSGAVTALDSADAVGVDVAGWVVVFRRAAGASDTIAYTPPSAGARRHLVAGLSPGRSYEYSVAGEVRGSVASGPGGIVEFEVTVASGQQVSLQ